MSGLFRSTRIAWFSMVLILGSVTWLVWIQGGADTRALRVVEWIVLAGMLVELLFSSANQGMRSRIDLFPSKWFFAVFFLSLLMFLQCLNPSHVLDPVTRYLNPVEHLSWLPCSVDRATSLQAFIWFLSCMGGFWITRCHLSVCHMPGRVLLVGLIVVVAVLSLQVVLQRITPQPFPVYPITGRFAYENHFAAFGNLLLPSACFLGWIMQGRGKDKNALSHPGYLFYGAGLLMVVAVLFSRSRAGMAISLLLFFLIVCHGRLDHLRALYSRAALLRKEVVLVVVSILLLIGLAGWMGREPVVEKFKTVFYSEGEIQYRKKLYASVLDMFESRRFVGTGVGTFALAFPFYQNPDIPGFFQHAHCDPLEVLAELGILGFLLMVLLLLSMVSPARLKKADPRDPNELLRFGLLISLLGLLVHSLIDFSFHLPVISFTASILAGMMCPRQAAEMPCRCTGAAIS